MDRFSFKAKGVSFHPQYPMSLLDLNEAWKMSGAVGEASLIRERDNPYDANAVAILVGGQVLGHVPKEVARFVGPMIDDGAQLRATATVLIDPRHDDRPGLLVDVERVY